MKLYKELTIVTNPFPVDLLTGFLWEAEPFGIVEEDNFLKVFVDESFDQSIIENILNEMKDGKVIDTYTISTVTLENKNWNEEWEKTLNIIHVSSKVVIRPSTKEYAPVNDEIVITIDPKMSFGTGEHQTTKLMIMAIEKYVHNGRVADIGTGTGVLAIAAIKFGAESAVAIDNDEWCLENGIENVTLNNVADKVTVLTGVVEDIPESDFDTVLANIQKNVLLEIAPALTAKVKNNGLLVLSGILLEDEPDILKKYAEFSFEKVETFVLNEWKAVVLRKL